MSTLTTSDEGMLDAKLVLEVLVQIYGVDLRGYQPDFVLNNLQKHTRDAGCERAIDLVPLLARDACLAQNVINSFFVRHTSLFRDPASFQGIQEHIFPWLRSFPVFRIWHAGCASGEEVLSLAILLEEAGIYDRATIFATDTCQHRLENARLGVVEQTDEPAIHAAYAKAGGAHTLSRYCTRHNGVLVFDRDLLRRVTFAQHNLAHDEVFSEVHLVVCRNVLIYFGPQLAARAARLFAESLCRGGYLWLGDTERVTTAGAHMLVRASNVKPTTVFRRIEGEPLDPAGHALRSPHRGGEPSIPRTKA